MKSVMYRLLGAILVTVSGLSLAWMFGWFTGAFPPGFFTELPLMDAWVGPHLHGFQLLVSILAGLIGLGLVFGVIGSRRPPK